MTEKEPKHSHDTVTCSRCNKTFDADTEEFPPCVPAGASHDLHGNLDGPGAPDQEE